MRQHTDCPGFLIDGFPREIQQGLQFEREVSPDTVSSKYINVLTIHKCMVDSCYKSPVDSVSQSLKIDCKSLNSLQVSVNISMCWGKYRECRRRFCFTSDLGTPAFALKDIFKIIHHSSLFVWVLLSYDATHVLRYWFSTLEPMQECTDCIKVPEG